MKTKRVSIEVSESTGSVSGEFITAEDMDFLYVFAHGAGAGMNHPFMQRLSVELLSRKIGTLRFNFPYMEKGGKRPDVPAIAEKTVLRAVDYAAQAFPDTRLLAGGKSFGGRMTSQALSKSTGSGVRGIVFVGFPLHAPGNHGIERASHLESVTVPMLFLQGTRDALADMALMEKVSGDLPLSTLKRFEGADHSFKAGKQDLIPALAASISEWATRVK